ncbi:MAG: rhodanese-like domain-containing protein [Prochloraceae cyanobacterium]|nr:rhodanese-like domain-containing protein [Prochloraceae cyanobacterium]
MSAQFYSEISVEELAIRLADPDPELQLIDVREPSEIAIAALAGFEILPLSQFQDWADTIKERFNPEAETLVICHHGVRSGQMCQWLLQNGFSNVKNIAGGIDAYSAIVDRDLPRY